MGGGPWISVDCRPARPRLSGRCAILPLARFVRCVTLPSFWIIRSSSMSIDSHLNELVRRHQAIEEAIMAEESHPAFDDIKVHELKVKKLHLKDQIERLKQKVETTVSH